MRKTIVDQIEISRSGVIGVRLLKLSSDGDPIGYHRASIEPGGDVEATLAAVSAHLQVIGNGAIEDTQMVRDVVELVHTPEKVSAFEAARAEL